MQEILNYSAKTHPNGYDTNSTETQASYKQKQELGGRLASLEAELRDVDADLERLTELRARLVKEKNGLVAQLRSHDQRSRGSLESVVAGQSRMDSGKINYMTEGFEWSKELEARMKAVFNINSFRLCQQG